MGSDKQRRMALAYMKLMRYNAILMLRKQHSMAAVVAARAASIYAIVFTDWEIEHRSF